MISSLPTKNGGLVTTIYGPLISIKKINMICNAAPG